jgi:hypothetical protein
MLQRYVTTVEQHLKNVVSTHQRDWDKKLPLFLQVYEASSQRNHKHDETKIRLLSGMLFGAPDEEQLTTN